MKFRLGMTLFAVVAVAAACGDDDDDQSPPTTGQIGVTTSTTGDDADDGYQLTIDNTIAGNIGANDQVVVPNLPPGEVQVGLADVAGNCAVAGDNPRAVTVVAGTTEQVQFGVSCMALNQPPVADAGDDQTVVDADGSGDEDVTLDGSASADPDGTIVSWVWSVGGQEIANGETPTVNLAVNTYAVTLTVTDDGGATDTDDVMITVEAAPLPVSFATDILPYFEAGQANCVQCHGATNQFAGVRLDSYTAVLTDGNNGPLVVPGNSADPTAILLPKVLADHNDGPDDAGFATTLATWIDEGALDN